MIKIFYGKCKDISLEAIDNLYLVERINKYTDIQEKKLKINVYYNLLKILKENNIYAEFNCDSLGKLYLKNNELFFNISHSHDYFAIAISSNEIGVDIEKIRFYNEKKLLALREKCLNEREKEIYPITSESFIKLWTVKESFLKLLGTGINMSLKNVVVEEKVTYKDKQANYLNFKIKDYILTVASFENIECEIIEIK